MVSTPTNLEGTGRADLENVLASKHERLVQAKEIVRGLEQDYVDLLEAAAKSNTHGAWARLRLGSMRATHEALRPRSMFARAAELSTYPHPPREVLDVGGLRRVYIAHPGRGDGSPEWGNLEQNLERYLRFVAHYTNRGCAVVTWVHHFLLQRRELMSSDLEFNLARDRTLLDTCGELVVAGPPSVSRGVRLEVEHAEKLGILITAKPEWEDPTFLPEV
jgi:hypothetical protein